MSGLMVFNMVRIRKLSIRKCFISLPKQVACLQTDIYLTRLNALVEPRFSAVILLIVSLIEVSHRRSPFCPGVCCCCHSLRKVAAYWQLNPFPSL